MDQWTGSTDKLSQNAFICILGLHDPEFISLVRFIKPSHLDSHLFSSNPCSNLGIGVIVHLGGTKRNEKQVLFNIVYN